MLEQIPSSKALLICALPSCGNEHIPIPSIPKLSRFKETTGHVFLFLAGRVQEKEEGSSSGSFDQQSEI